MRGTTMRCGLTAVFALFAATQIHASTIEGFTFTPASSLFTTDLTTSFTSNEATVSGTVSCESATKCAGELGSFSLLVDLTGVSTSTLEVSGNLTGDRAVFGLLNLSSPVFLPLLPFTIPVGSFDKTLASATLLPDVGLIDLAGTIDLGMLPGQTLTLPLTITINNGAAVPEPSSFLFLAGAVGVMGFVRYRRLQRTA